MTPTMNAATRKTLIKLVETVNSYLIHDIGNRTTSGRQDRMRELIEDYYQQTEGVSAREGANRRFWERVELTAKRGENNGK